MSVDFPVYNGLSNINNRYVFELLSFFGLAPQFMDRLFLLTSGGGNNQLNNRLSTILDSVVHDPEFDTSRALYDKDKLVVLSEDTVLLIE